MFLGIILLILFLYYQFKNSQYKKTDYYIQTQNHFFRVYTDKGLYGEYLTWKYLKKLSGYKKYLFNCYVPKDNGETTEIDVILLHESGIYVFESKNYSGWIFGTETQPYWTQTLPTGRGQSRKEHFFNPILQNNVHIKWLCQTLHQNPTVFRSYIVFSDHCTLKKITLTSGKHYVLNRHRLFSAVSTDAKTHLGCLSQQEIDSIYNKLYPLTQADASLKAAHINNIKLKHSSMDNNLLTCPQCGGKLILRVAKKGKNCGKTFLGCSNYPKCRYIRDNPNV